MVRTMIAGDKLEKRECNALRFSGTLSTRKVDSYKSKVVDPDFSRWLKNPIITDMHNTELVIGLGEKIDRDPVTGTVRLTGIILDPYIKDKVAKGLVRGLSIGFDPAVTVFAGADGVMVYVRPVVMEVGVCPLPSNDECTIDTVTCANEGVAA